MIRHLILENEEAQYAIKSGDFSSKVIQKADAVVLVLTQSWCPQWVIMSKALKGLGESSQDLDLAIITHEYDLSDDFTAFTAFKEKKFQNWEVPYVRLYKKGNFISDANFIPVGQIIDLLRRN